MMISTLRNLTEVVAETLDVERVSLWQFSANRTALECIELYRRRKEQHSSGLILKAEDFPEYFRVLETSEAIIAHNALEDPRTKEFADSHLRSEGISSMLDVPIYLFGRLHGVLCHEYAGASRFWRPDETVFGLSVGNLVSLALEQEERRKTENALVASNRELEAFSYSVSHDLRGPVRHISGFAGLLQSQASSLDAESHEYLAEISRSARRMGNLIDDLLDFAQIGRSEMKKSLVPLSPLVAEAVEALKSETAGRRIFWRIRPLPVVEVDRPLLRQVFINLISNAVKYSRPRPEAEIEVGVLDGSAESSEVVCFVKDNGVGFDMKYVHKLFGVFQRLHPGTEFEGTGIGLANVQRIIHRHGGRVWAEGKVNAGATFFFSVPSPHYSGSRDRLLVASRDPI
jgi:signal transduction histidine kinase